MVSPSSVMNSTSYPPTGWTNTTVPRSPRNSPWSARSSVKTTVSSSLIMSNSLQRIGSHESRHVLAPLDKPDRSHHRCPAVRRWHRALNHVADAERRRLLLHDTMTARVVQEGERHFLPDFWPEAEPQEEERLVPAVAVCQRQQVPGDLL